MNSNSSLPSSPPNDLSARDRRPHLYTPWMTGRYTASAGLSRLSPGETVTLWDQTTPHYLDTKRRQYDLAREEYVQYHRFDEPIASAAVERLAPFLPSSVPPSPSLESLALSIPDDLAIISRSPDGTDHLSALLVFFPNGWSPREKIGQSFFNTHTPVPGIEPVNSKAAHFVNLMIHADQPLQRFVWGLRFDDFLDHRPQAPALSFNPTCPRAFLRVERQIILGLPSHHSALFLIRTFLYDLFTLPPETLPPLLAALESLSPDTAHYKGLTHALPTLIPWIKTLPQAQQI